MNRMPVLTFAAAFALLASFAQAQPKPALVQDRDEPGRSPYQSQATPDCDGQILCSIELATVPAGTRLVVTTLSVSLGTSGSGGVPAFCTTLGSGDFQLNFEIGGAGSFRTLSQAITRYYEAGQTPSILCSIGTGSFSGTGRGGMAGYLVSLP